MQITRKQISWLSEFSLILYLLEDLVKCIENFFALNFGTTE